MRNAQLSPNEKGEAGRPQAVQPCSASISHHARRQAHLGQGIPQNQGGGLALGRWLQHADPRRVEL
eukprot:6955539-Prorocentrum_lima.AAC.1